MLMCVITRSGWTALVYACAGGGAGAVECARRLLAGGARVDAAAARSDDVCTLTPLQVRSSLIYSCRFISSGQVIYL